VDTDYLHVVPLVCEDSQMARLQDRLSMSQKCIPGEIAFVIFAGILWVLRIVIKKFGMISLSRKRNGMPRGFGISYQLRRRRLDMGRSDSSIRTSIGEKIRRQRNGLLKRKRKRK